MEITRCELCPRRCGAHRTAHGGDGICGAPAAPRLARAALHTGEEPILSGTRGAGTVFFSGCQLRCCFCQNYAVSHENLGHTVSADRLADIFRELEAQGAHNIDLVSPTPYVDSIRAALDLYRPAIPIVYNSSGYERIETLRSLEGYIDIYLPDFKYVSRELAASLSGAPDYADYALPAILEMLRQTGPIQLDADGIALRGTMVRHLVLPGHTRESLAVLEALTPYRDTLWVSLMFQYTPFGKLDDHPELRRALTHRECDKVWQYMNDLGFENGFVQDRSGSGTQYIPVFDLTGVVENNG